jgi:MFS family permease
VPVFFFLASLGGIMIPVAYFADHQDELRPRSGAPRHKLVGMDWLQLLMLLLFFSGFNSIYSYWARFGAHAGVSTEFVAQMLSIGNLVALAGLTIALLAADRIGVRMPILICLCLLALSAWISSHGGAAPPPLGHVFFALAVITDQTCAVVVVPFVLTLMAMQDRRGAVTAAAPSAMNIGNVLGPTIAVTVSRFGYVSIGWTAISFYVIGFVVLLIVSRRHVQE